MKYKIARIHDTEIDSEFICEMKSHTHKTVYQGEIEFSPDCLFCDGRHVNGIEETIQFGMDTDKHYLLVFCYDCKRASFHIYEVSE